MSSKIVFIYFPIATGIIVSLRCCFACCSILRRGNLSYNLYAKINKNYFLFDLFFIDLMTMCSIICFLLLVVATCR